MRRGRGVVGETGSVESSSLIGSLFAAGIGAVCCASRGGGKGLAAGGSRLGSSTSMSPCLRRLLSQSSNIAFTCCCNRISCMRAATSSSGGIDSPLLYWAKGVAIVARDLIRGDADALAKAQFDEAENLKPVAQVGFDSLLRQVVRGQELLPPHIGGAVGAHARWNLLANLRQPRIHFALLRGGGFNICWRICCWIRHVQSTAPGRPAA